MREAKLPKQTLHHGIIAVGVDAQMAAPGDGPVQTEGADTLFRAVGGDPVHDAVGAAVQPGAVRDLPVGGLDVFPADIIEIPLDCPFFVGTDVTVSLFDVVMDQRLRRPVRRSPLVGVSCLRHEFSRMGIDLHDPVKVCFRSFSYLHDLPHLITGPGCDHTVDRSSDHRPGL